MPLSRCNRIYRQTSDDSANQFVIAVLLILKYQEEREVVSQLADVMHALRTAARKEIGACCTVEFGVHGLLPRLSGLLEVV